MVQKANTPTPGLKLEDGWWGQYTITSIKPYTVKTPSGELIEMLLVHTKQGKSKRSWTFSADQDVWTVV